MNPDAQALGALAKVQLCDAVLGTLDEPLFILDDQGRAVFVNRAGARWCGASPATLEHLSARGVSIDQTALGALQHQQIYLARIGLDETRLVRLETAEGPVQAKLNVVVAQGRRWVVLRVDARADRRPAARTAPTDPLSFVSGARPLSHVCASPAPSGAQRILLADDDPLVRSVTHSVLSQGGYQVVEAGDGAEAMRQYESPGAKFDLVVLDMHMPHLTGADVLEQIRARTPGQKAILLSGTMGVAEAMPVWPDVVCVHKPYSNDELLRHVRELTGQEPMEQ